jgi:hypothetical protein
MVWDERRIIQELRDLYRRGADLSYNALARQRQSLLSAAAYHLGSYRRAVEAASIPYEQVLRRPRWTRQRIIKLIKAAHAKKTRLHWSAVTLRRDELARAAFAALQPRLFGRWDKALAAAGLDPDRVSRYRSWNRAAIVAALRQRHRDGKPLGSGALQKHNASLHAAAVRHCGTYERALLLAKIDPQQVRQRKNWNRARVIDALRCIHRDGRHVSDSAVRQADAALYGACVRLFGQFTKARAAAKINFDRAPKRHKKRKK